MLLKMLLKARRSSDGVARRCYLKRGRPASLLRIEALIDSGIGRRKPDW